MRRPTLILSGVNWGSNLADDVTYSGTIAGAMEGCALGIPSVALSQSYDEASRLNIDWSAGEAHGARCGAPSGGSGLAGGHLDECELPRLSGRRASKASRWCRKGKYDLQSTEIEERMDARQRAYYWIGLRRRRATPPDDSDLGAVTANRIAVTPLHLNLTELSVLDRLRGALAK